jgi:hypothetical protein
MTVSQILMKSREILFILEEKVCIWDGFVREVELHHDSMLCWRSIQNWISSAGRWPLLLCHIQLRHWRLVLLSDNWCSQRDDSYRQRNIDTTSWPLHGCSIHHSVSGINAKAVAHHRAARANYITRCTSFDWYNGTTGDIMVAMATKWADCSSSLSTGKQ